MRCRSAISVSTRSFAARSKPRAYDTTFPIQALTLPLAMNGQDIIGQARTGTGKTLAFGIPILHRLATTLAGERAAKQPAALVIVPTRELAIQVTDDIKQAGAQLGARVLTVYGGRAYEPQIDALAAGVDVVVGTPGRLLDLANRKNLDLSQIRALVLDEADKMLDLGFLPDVERLLRLTPDDRQTMLFSATMPGEVVTLARRHLRQPTNIRAEGLDESAPPPLTTQFVYRTHHLDKIEVLARVLQAKDRGLAMVFCQTKRACDQVSIALTERGFAAATVHGDLGQAQRERALRAFRTGKVDVLVATDVAARGIDVDDVTHVINYECPDDQMAYVHRIGRTGRAGRTGVAVTFVDWRDLHRWKLISDGARPRPARACRDLLNVRAPVHRSVHPARRHRHPPPRATRRQGRALRRGGRGSRRNRQNPVQGPPGRRSRSRSRKPGDDGSSRSGGAQEATTAKARRRHHGRRRRAPSAQAPHPRRPRTWVMRRPQSPDMSTPTSLELPEGTRRATVETARGSFAALDAMPAAGPCELGTALLVPGYTGSKEDFIAILGELAAAGRRVVAIDLRGQYQTDGADDPGGYDLAELGADVTAVAEATEASHLLGHSFGGLVARAAVLDGYSPASLTLLSSGPAALPGARAEELHRLLNYLDGTPRRISRARSRSCGTLAQAQAVKAGVAAPVVAFLEAAHARQQPDRPGHDGRPATEGRGQDRAISPPGRSPRSSSTARTTTPGRRMSSRTWPPG